MGVGREDRMIGISTVTLKPEKNGVPEEKNNSERNEFCCMGNNTVPTLPSELIPKLQALAVSIREPNPYQQRTHMQELKRSGSRGCV